MRGRERERARKMGVAKDVSGQRQEESYYLTEYPQVVV